HEISGEQEDIAFEGFTIRAFRVNHNVTCYGYSLTIPRAGKFDKDRALAQDIPLKLWSRLQKGEVIEQDGRTYTPDMVMGVDRKGLKVTYSTDTRPTASIEENATGSDLLILEGMYGDEENFAKAKEHRHMMMQEAARIAAKAQVPELWLTHYSPALPKPDVYLEELRGIFPNVVTARDGRSVELRFEDEESE
ncbi:MAG: ribonuclease Z, partial [Lachnospiraceae bacterium]|nr:ribonuclease Z [Lachnospiraceae bacterium]